MSRRYSFATGSIYHIYNRGVRKVNIFEDASDYIRWESLLAWCFQYDYPYSRYLDGLRELKSPIRQEAFCRLVELSYRYKNPLVEILTYVEMSNHFHLVIEQKVENGVSIFMRKLATAYSMYINKKYDLSGAVFEGSYKTVPVASDPQLTQLLLYVLRNPIEAKLVTNETVFRYKWSATKEYLHKNERRIVSLKRLPDYFSDKDKLKKFIENKELELELNTLGDIAIDL